MQGILFTTGNKVSHRNQTERMGYICLPKKGKSSSCIMHWLILIIAGVFEVGFTTCLSKARHSEGAAFWWWGWGFLVCLFLSMYLLYRSTEAIPMGTAYGVWTGIGACGTALVGIFFFKESADWWRIFFLFTLIASVVGLKWVSSS